MDICCLGNHSAAPCYGLRLCGITLLLDCGLDISTLDQFQPQASVHTPAAQSSMLKESGSISCKDGPSGPSGPVFVRPPLLDFFDLSSIDAVLLSNSSYVLALPYLLKSGQFRGRILATQPALQLGRLLMEELSCYSSTPKCTSSAHEDRQLSVDAQEAIRNGLWQEMYSMDEIADAVQRVELVSFGQAIDLFGLLKVTAFSSGSSLGSCNWLLQTPFDKVVYLSASSQLTTHPQTIQLSSLSNADAMLISGMSLAPTLNPDGMIGAICEGVASTLRSEGNVLFPVFPTGVIYDLLECLLTYMEQQGLQKVPIFFISPVADASLAFANIYGEWTSTVKQNKLYQPEPPFAHAELIKADRLRFFPNIHGAFNKSFRSPCVVFAGHPSLRLGDAVHFLKLWGSSRRNTVILTESEYAKPSVLTPFQPLSMKTLIHPIDTRLNFHQVNRLMQELKPKYVVAPETHLQPPPTQPHRTDLSIDRDLAKCSGISHSEVVSLPLQSAYQRAMLSLELAECLDFTECQSSVFAASVSACLLTENNQHSVIVPGSAGKPWHRLATPLKGRDGVPTTAGATGHEHDVDTAMEIVDDVPSVKTAALGKRVWTGSGSSGIINVDLLREALLQRGLSQHSVQKMPTGCRITLTQDSKDVASIVLEEGATRVTCSDASNTTVLPLIRDALLEQLRVF